jgi:hypothetical protein
MVGEAAVYCKRVQSLRAVPPIRLPQEFKRKHLAVVKGQAARLQAGQAHPTAVNLQVLVVVVVRVVLPMMKPQLV